MFNYVQYTCVLVQNKELQNVQGIPILINKSKSSVMDTLVEA